MQFVQTYICVLSTTVSTLQTIDNDILKLKKNLTIGLFFDI